MPPAPPRRVPEEIVFYAHVLLDNPAGETATGAMFMVDGGLEWQPVRYLKPYECDHGTTMCWGCVDSWELDHEVRLPNLV
jgi:hypothetical protein